MLIKFISVEEIVVDIPEEEWKNAVKSDTVEYDYDTYRSDMDLVEDYAVDENGVELWRGC